jgi:hypothetical protein
MDRLVTVLGLCVALAAGCGANSINHGVGVVGPGADLGGTGGNAGGGGGGGGGGGWVPPDGGGTTYTVYAHSNTTLYTIDVMNKSITTVGAFNAPMVGGSADVIQDLAVAPDNTIYVVSKSALYTADPTDGHVTSVGSVSACGSDNVALTTTKDGKLYVADYKGAFCQIDISVKPPTVMSIGSVGQNMAISGDIVGIGDGSVYGTAYNLSDSSTTGTSINNVLVKIDPSTGAMQTQIGPTGFPKLFGVAYANGVVFGFTHDGSGDVITIDPKTGKGTLFNTFLDPTTGKGIPFAGAGVNSMVPPTPIG